MDPSVVGVAAMLSIASLMVWDDRPARKAATPSPSRPGGRAAPSPTIVGEGTPAAPRHLDWIAVVDGDGELAGLDRLLPGQRRRGDGCRHRLLVIGKRAAAELEQAVLAVVGGAHALGEVGERAGE